MNKEIRKTLFLNTGHEACVTISFDNNHFKNPNIYLFKQEVFIKVILSVWNDEGGEAVLYKDIEKESFIVNKGDNIHPYEEYIENNCLKHLENIKQKLNPIAELFKKTSETVNKVKSVVEFNGIRLWENYIDFLTKTLKLDSNQQVILQTLQN